MRCLEGVRREVDATVLALAEIPQSAWRHHSERAWKKIGDAPALWTVLDMAEKHLKRLRGYGAGVREYLHSVVMNGGGGDTLSIDTGTMPTYERMAAPSNADGADWPLTFDELDELRTHWFILRYSEYGGAPTYSKYETAELEQAMWNDLADDYADEDEGD
jgi:hypothetical protein